MRGFFKVIVLYFCAVWAVLAVDDDALSNNENVEQDSDDEVLLKTYLSQEGADLNIRDGLGRTLLMIAAEKGRLACVVRLLPYVEIDALSDSGMSALMYACTARDTAAVVARALMDAGANIFTQDRWGETATMIACRWGDCNLLNLLLERNPDLFAGNVRGQTALRLALERQDPWIVDLLLRAAFDTGPIHEQGVEALLRSADDDSMMPLPEEDVRSVFALYYGHLPGNGVSSNAIWERISLIFRFLLSPLS